MNNYCDRLKELREDAGLSRSQLASKFRYTPSTIKKWEQGDRNINLETLRAYHNLFRVSYDFLLDGKTEKNNLEELLQSYETLSKDEKKCFFHEIVERS